MIQTDRCLVENDNCRDFGFWPFWGRVEADNGSLFAEII